MIRAHPLRQKKLWQKKLDRKQKTVCDGTALKTASPKRACLIART
jgi:hypothetical protein